MSQDIVVRYKAEVDELTRDLNRIIEQQEQITKGQKEGKILLDSNISTQEAAAKKRIQLLKLEEAELTKLIKLRNLAYDPKVIREYDRKIADTTKNISVLKGETDKLGTTSKAIFSGMGTALAAVFSVGAIINFGNSAVNAFLEAQESADRLKFAITQIAGESEDVFDRLIAQSKQLQDGISVFSDEQIQKSQAALANFGLLGFQIEKLIPKIVDLAAANKIDLLQATDAVIRGIEGQNRGLITLGLKFDDTGSRLGNYNLLLDKLDKNTGAAAAQTETLAGQLEVAKNRSEELQEQLGEGLAPTFVKLKTAALEAALGLLGFNEQQEKNLRDRNTTLQNDIQKSAEVLEKNGKDVVAAFTARAEELNAQTDLVKKANDELIKSVEERQKALLSTGKEFVDPERDPVIKKLRLEIQQNEKIIELNVIKATFFKDEADRRTEELAQLARVLKIEDLEIKKTEELIALKKIEAEGNDQTAKDNVDLINKVLEAREKANKKAAEDARRAAEKLAAENEKIFEDFKKQLDAEQDALLRSIDRTAQELKDKAALLEFKVRLTAQIEGEDAALIQARDALFKEFQEENIRAEKATSDTVEEVNAQKQRNYEQYISNLTKLVGDFKMFEFETYDESTKRLQEELELRDQEYSEFLDRVQTLTFAVIDSIERISGSFTSRELQRIEDRKNAELSALDVQQQAIADSLETRRISESEASKLSRDLLEKRIQAEKKALEEERKAKKKQAILDKAAALIKIAISTAVNSIEQPGPFGALIPYWVALGALEAGVVAAEPIPYKKGSKDTGKKGHMARVGEEGEEIVYMPSHSKVLPARQTKTYGEALDAMMDNRFEKYVMKKYVAPALLGQQKNYAEKKDKQFARNITESMIIQATGLTPSEYRKIHKEGFNLNNPEAVAQALAPLLRDNPYLRR